tara:strand:- start:151 stop:369 length:219 start_codon:yes stop_codon:yes gene_type:complete
MAVKPKLGDRSRSNKTVGKTGVRASTVSAKADLMRVANFKSGKANAKTQAQLKRVSDKMNKKANSNKGGGGK